MEQLFLSPPLPVQTSSLNQRKVRLLKVFSLMELFCALLLMMIIIIMYDNGGFGEGARGGGGGRVFFV